MSEELITEIETEELAYPTREIWLVKHSDRNDLNNCNNFVRKSPRRSKPACLWLKQKDQIKLHGMGLTADDIVEKIFWSSHGLKAISLIGNPIQTVPQCLVTELRSLSRLCLSRCEIRELPAEWNLPKLISLDLSFNRLRDFPQENLFRGLPQLKELTLYGNKIFHFVLPSDCKCLSLLEILNVGFNEIPYVPEDLSCFPRLKRLNLSCNFLESIPESICQMPSLRSIDTSYNPILVPPHEVCDRGLGSMRRYYKNTKKVGKYQRKTRLDISPASFLIPIAHATQDLAS